MDMSIYDLGVKYTLGVGFIVTIILCLVYLIPLCVRYVKGEELKWDDQSVRHFNPLKNTEVSWFIFFPIIIFICSIIVSFSWFISIPGIIIFLTLRYFRNINLSKQKMWNTLKGEQ